MRNNRLKTCKRVLCALCAILTHGRGNTRPPAVNATVGGRVRLFRHNTQQERTGRSGEQMRRHYMVDFGDRVLKQDKGVMLLALHHSGLRRPATPVGGRRVSYLFRETRIFDADPLKNRSISGIKPS